MTGVRKRPPWVAILAIAIICAFALVLMLLLRPKPSPQARPSAAPGKGGDKPIAQGPRHGEPSARPVAAGRRAANSGDSLAQLGADRKAQAERARRLKERLARLSGAKKTGKAKQRPPKSGALASGERVHKRVEESDPSDLPQAVRPVLLQKVPGSAETIFVNNEEVPVENLGDLKAQRAGFVRPALYVPMGRTLICFGKLGTKAIAERGLHLAQAYRSRRQTFMKGSNFDIRKLANLSRECAEDFRTPYVPHFLGCYYQKSGKLDAACRKYRRALHINPCFTPAHLNLAHLYYRMHKGGVAESTISEVAKPELRAAGRGELLESDGPELRDAAKQQLLAAAKRELKLAYHFNIRDVFGVEACIAKMADELELTALKDTSVKLSPELYTGATSEIREADKDVRSALNAAKRYVSSPLIHAKIESNIGVYYTMDRRHDLAVSCYLRALTLLKAIEESPKKRETMRKIYQNLQSAFAQRDWAEKEEYKAIVDTLQH